MLENITQLYCVQALFSTVGLYVTEHNTNLLSTSIVFNCWALCNIT